MMSRDAPTDTTPPPEPLLILVDPRDRVTGYAGKERCHDGRGLLHRAVSVFVTDGAGRVLLQRRADPKRLWPGRWSNSCCGHPVRGESYAAAASRRLREELGLTCPLRRLFKFTYFAPAGAAGSEHETCTVFLGTDDSPPAPDPSEVDDLRYATPSEIDRELYYRPDSFTPWFLLEWERVRRILKGGETR